jgi:hypothetical protein
MMDNGLSDAGDSVVVVGLIAGSKCREHLLSQ